MRCWLLATGRRDYRQGEASTTAFWMVREYNPIITSELLFTTCPSSMIFSCQCNFLSRIICALIFLDTVPPPHLDCGWIFFWGLEWPQNRKKFHRLLESATRCN